MSEEINSIYGEIFEELREQNELKKEDFKSVGIPRTTLSDFEAGKTLLRHDKLVAALELLHIEEGEYALMINDYHPDYFKTIMKRLIHANWKSDTETIQKIYEESRQNDQRLIELSSSNLLHKRLNGREKYELRDYFFSNSRWTMFDLMVLSLTVDQLEENLSISIIKDFWRDNFHYIDSARYRTLIIQIGQRLTLTLIEHKKRFRSEFVFSKLDTLIRESDVQGEICQRFIKGYHLYKFSDKDQGILEMKRSLAILEELNCYELLSYYQNFYNFHVK